jgi:hypothetical protein
VNAYLERLRAAIDAATHGITAEELARHPEGKWSASEVLEHLSLTYSGTTRGFEKCLQAGHPLATSPHFKQRLGTMLVVGIGYFPSGREAPNGTRPKGLPAGDFVTGIGGLIAAMDKAIEDCEVRYGRRTLLLDHPVLGPLTANQWRKFHWVHGKHHMKQIRSLRGAVG